MVPRNIEEELAKCDVASEQDVYLMIDTEKVTDTGEVRKTQRLMTFKGEYTDKHIVVEGCIIAEDIKAATEKANISINKYRWPSDGIPYSFDPQYYDQLAWRATIEAAIKEMNKQTNVLLYEVKSPPSQANGKPIDHIFFSRDDDRNKNHAIIGYRPGRGKHEVYLSRDFTVGLALHEIGHALGLWHEHTRSDRDDFIEVCWKNVKTESICVFRRWKDFSIPYGDYDYESVMHYADHSPNLAIDPSEPIMKCKTEGKKILGQRSYLSAGDKAGINKMYPEKMKRKRK